MANASDSFWSRRLVLLGGTRVVVVFAEDVGTRADSVAAAARLPDLARGSISSEREAEEEEDDEDDARRGSMPGKE